MRLSSKLRSKKQGKLVADLSYLEQTSKLSQSLKNKDTEELADSYSGDGGVSNLQLRGGSGGISPAMTHILGTAALGALTGVMGGIGGAPSTGMLPQVGAMPFTGSPMPYTGGPMPGMGYGPPPMRPGPAYNPMPAARPMVRAY